MAGVRTTPGITDSPMHGSLVGRPGRDMKEQRVSRRKFLSLMAIGAGSAALAACQPAAPAAPPTSAPAQATEAPKVATPTSVPTPTPLPISAEQTEILWWDGNAFEEYIAFWDEMIAGYTKEDPKLVVTPVHSKNFDSFVTATAGGAAPDVYFMWDGCEPLGSWIQQGLVLALDDNIAAVGYDPNGMIPGALESVRYKGKIYGLPELADDYMIQRSLKACREASLSTDPIATIEDLYTQGDKLTKRDGQGNITRLGLALPTSGWQLWEWLWMWGGSLWNEEAMEVTPDNPGVLRAVDELVKYYQKYGKDNLQRFYSSQGQSFSAEDTFVVGNTTLRIEADWMFDVMHRYAPDLKFGEDWDAFAVPYSPDVPAGKGALHVSPYPLVLSAGSKKGAEAFKVMAWMQDLERTVKAGAYMANVPQTKTALEEALKRGVGTPGWNVAVKLALESTNQHAFPVTPISAEYSDRFQQELGLVVNGEKEAKAAMTALKAELQSSLQKATQ